MVKGIAEQKSSGLQNSLRGRTAPAEAGKKASTIKREAFYLEFCEKIQKMNSPVPIQLSGGFKTRAGMAQAIDSGACQLIGLGRTVVLEPMLPARVLLNPAIPDDQAIATPHEVKGMWLSKLIPIKVIGAGLPLRYLCVISDVACRPVS